MTDEAVEGFLAAQLLHTDVGSAWQALRADDPRQELEAGPLPVLVLWGAEDFSCRSTTHSSTRAACVRGYA